MLWGFVVHAGSNVWSPLKIPRPAKCSKRIHSARGWGSTNHVTDWLTAWRAVPHERVLIGSWPGTIDNWASKEHRRREEVVEKKKKKKNRMKDSNHSLKIQHHFSTNPLPMPPGCIERTSRMHGDDSRYLSLYLHYRYQHVDNRIQLNTTCWSIIRTWKE